ncbi:DMT family transporter [Haloarcula pellucida]|uniref:Membrane protein n=1 Tax=Haloarcula pellucida TaxID=1427151 RepID=A0A830GI27_9EURY|nr:DMT family transporter [Halomicroarcula pellucida]MBX0347842.1 DMT family transporter [Halomicroarcula pellucida]GGN90535.1 membrane protein [Halomicroarcula pellucida]
MVSRRVLALGVAASVLFGGTFVAAKAGLDHFPPLLFVALRFDVAAVALLGYVALTRSRSDLLPQSRGDALGILSTGLLALGLTNALLFVGQQDATSAVGAIVFSLNPILTPVFAALLLADERLSKRGAVGLLVGLLGVALVVNPDPEMLFSGGGGKLLLFGGAVSGALGSVLVRWSDSDLSSTVRTAWALPVAAALCHGLSWQAGESVAAVSWGPAALVALLYVGVFAGAVAYVAYFGLLDRSGATHANLVFYVVPVVSTLGGWALLGESISELAVVGFLTIFVGFAVLGSESIAIPSIGSRLPTDAVVSTDALDVGEDATGFESD